MSEPVQQGAGKSLGAKDIRPFLEGQVRGQHEAVMLIGPADDLEEQFGSCLGEGDISQFINHQEMESLDLFVQSLKPFFFPALHQLGNQVHSRIEANASALGASGEGQGTDQVCFAGSRISNEEHVFSFVQVFPSQKLPNQGLFVTWFSIAGISLILLTCLCSEKVVLPSLWDHFYGP